MTGDRTEFIEAARAQAFGDEQIIHCLGGFTGADWDLAGVIATIERATDVQWIDDWADHDLAVLDDNRIWRFAVQRPSPTGSREDGGAA